MTCFWNGLYHKLSDDDFKFINEIKCKSLQDLITLLKRYFNLFDIDYIFYHGSDGKIEPLSKQFLSECKKAVLDYNIESMYNGYYCSTCDPFLILVCMLFKITIEHKYINVDIKYIPRESRRKISCNSDSGHFW